MAERHDAGRGVFSSVPLAADLGPGPEAVAEGCATGRGVCFSSPLAADFGPGQPEEAGLRRRRMDTLLDGKPASLRLSQLTSGRPGGGGGGEAGDSASHRLSESPPISVWAGGGGGEACCRRTRMGSLILFAARR